MTSAPAIRKDDPNVSLVTVGHRRFYAYRYEGKVSDCEKAVVLLCYSEKSLGNPDALRVFISTQTNLSTQEGFKYNTAIYPKVKDAMKEFIKSKMKDFSFR